jgi:hypothetical protein
MLSECLVYSFTRLGVPFIALRQLGAIGDNLGRQFLPSVSPVRHLTATVVCPVRDFLPNRALSTVAAPGSLAHRTLSGAHRTVRCPLPTVGAATHRPQISRPTVGSPDSPVNYSHVAFFVSREQRVHRR